MHSFLSLSLIYLSRTCFFFFFFFLRWEKEKHHCTKYTGNQMKMLVNLSHHNWAIPVLIWDMQYKHVWFDSITRSRWDPFWASVYPQGNSHNNLSCDCYFTAKSTASTLINTLTNGALFIQMYTNTDCAWFHIYIHKPLGCYCLVCLTINRVGLIHKIIWPAHSFLCLLRGNRHLKTHVHIYK